MTKTDFYQKLKTGDFSRMVRESIRGEQVGNSRELRNIITPLVAQEPDVEQFWCLFLDTRNRIRGIEILAKGTINAAYVYPREVIKKILHHQAAAVILAHNHPSGDCNPSGEDLKLTLQIALACKSIGVTIHEHIIVGDTGNWYSMADNGKMAGIVGRVQKMIDETT